MPADKTAVAAEPTVLPRREPEAVEPVQAPLTTTALVHLALEKGADPGTLERLMALHERWEAGEARKAYTAAMAQFKAECPPVLRKDATVKYGNTNYRHATLGSIIDEITPHLSRNGLSVAWESSQANGDVTITCRVTHVLGHSEAVSLTGPPDNSGQKNKIQQIGSSVTYLQRYTLLSALGLATAEQDDDGVATGARTPEDRDAGIDGLPGPDRKPRQRTNGPPPGAGPRSGNGTPKDRAKRAAAAVAHFASLGVLQADLERWLAGETEPPVPMASWSDADIDALRATFSELRKLSGKAQQDRVREVFGLQPATVEG